MSIRLTFVALLFVSACLFVLATAGHIVEASNPLSASLHTKKDDEDVRKQYPHLFRFPPLEKHNSRSSIAVKNSTEKIVQAVTKLLNDNTLEGTHCFDNNNKKHKKKKEALAQEDEEKKGKGDCYDFRLWCPSGGRKYEKAQWLWDSVAMEIASTHINVTNSMRDLDAMMMGQHKDGFIAETTFFWVPQTPKQNLVNDLWYGETKETKITQVPIPPFSLWAIWNKTGDRAFIAKQLPKIVKYLNWFKNTLQLSESGLASVLHGWQAGTDSACIFDEAYMGTEFANKHPQPTHDQMYTHFVTLMLTYNDWYHWNMSEILGRKKAADNSTWIDGWFFVEDLLTNSALSRGWGYLGDLARDALHDNDLAQTCYAEEKRIGDAILRYSWNKKLNRFSTRYRRRDGTWEFSRCNSANNLMPIMVRTLPTDIFETLLHTQLLNPKKFWTSYPIPSTPADDATFHPTFNESYDLMWRGPVWQIQTWFTMIGLQDRNLNSIAHELAARTLAAVEIADFNLYEQYNTFNATGYGTPMLSMSSLIIDMLFRTGIA